MPIECACECGRRLRVADQFAGRRVRCPECQTAVAVPAPEPQAEFEVVEEPPAPPKPAKARAVVEVEDDGDDEPPPPRPRKKSKRRPADEEGPTARMYMREANERIRRDEERERTRRRESGDGYTFGGVHVTAGVVAGGTLLIAGLVALAVLLLLRADGRPGTPRLFAVAAIGTILGVLTLVKALVFGEED